MISLSDLKDWIVAQARGTVTSNPHTMRNVCEKAFATMPLAVSGEASGEACLSLEDMSLPLSELDLVAATGHAELQRGEEQGDDRDGDTRGARVGEGVVSARAQDVRHHHRAHHLARVIGSTAARIRRQADH